MIVFPCFITYSFTVLFEEGKAILFFIMQTSILIRFIVFADTKGGQTSKKKKNRNKGKEKKKTSPTSAFASTKAPASKEVTENLQQVRHMMSIVVLLVISYTFSQ